MFDYDLEVAELEREIFSNPAKMETTFNYVDLSFQLFPLSFDETFTLVARHLDELRRYYDEKSCFNLNHSKNIIDILDFASEDMLFYPSIWIKALQVLTHLNQIK